MPPENPYAAPQAGFLTEVVAPPESYWHYLWSIGRPLSIFFAVVGLLIGLLNYATFLYQHVRELGWQIALDALFQLTLTELPRLAFSFIVGTLLYTTLFAVPLSLLRWLRARRLYRAFLAQQVQTHIP